MIFVDDITKKEEEILKGYYKHGPNSLIRARAQALLMSYKRADVRTIAEYVDYTTKTVRLWVHAWNERRMGSIFPAYKNNENAAKLTKEQKAEIEKTATDLKGVPDTFWDLPRFKNHISTTFGVVYESDRSYHYLLRHIGLSWKLPTPFDVRRDEKEIAKRMVEIKDEIEPYIADDAWEVFVSDETRIDWEEEIRRAWLPKGEKTIVRLERKKTGQSYFGALSLKTKKHHLIPLDWQDTDNTISALLKLQKKYPDKRICIIWDNARWHKSKLLREKLSTGESLERYHLINFPPYAPDHNPEEHVWKYGKEKIANTHFASFDDLKIQFTALLNNKTFDYKM